MLPQLCTVITHRGRQNMPRTSVTHSTVLVLGIHLVKHSTIVNSAKSIKTTTKCALVALNGKLTHLSTLDF